MLPCQRLGSWGVAEGVRAGEQSTAAQKQPAGLWEEEEAEGKPADLTEPWQRIPCW